MAVYKTNQIILHVYSLYLQIRSPRWKENSPVFMESKGYYCAHKILPLDSILGSVAVPLLYYRPTYASISSFRIYRHRFCLTILNCSVNNKFLRMQYMKCLTRPCTLTYTQRKNTQCGLQKNVCTEIKAAYKIIREHVIPR